MMAALHAIPAEPHPALDVDWPAFVDRQCSTAAARHAASGADPRWVEHIDETLGSIVRELPLG